MRAINSMNEINKNKLIKFHATIQNRIDFVDIVEHRLKRKGERKEEKRKKFSDKLTRREGRSEKRGGRALAPSSR